MDTMDSVTQEELKGLAQPKSGVAVSMYLPTHRAGADVRENAIRFKNRVQEAERLLGEQGMDEKEIDALLEPAHKLEDDNEFWQHQADGLAMFISGDEVKQYRVPVEFEPLTTVSDRYHLKPLMSLLSGGGQFYVLVASLNKAQLFEGSRGGLTELDLPEDTPTSLDEATRFDEPAAGRREHGGNAPLRSREASAPGTGMSHGTGDVEYDKKADIREWFAWLDNGVRDTIDTSDQTTPLLFAGVDYVFALYKEANKYNGLMDEHLSGNPDEWNRDEVHEKAWEVVSQHFDQEKKEAMQRYKAVAHEDTSSDNLEEIVKNAVDARIDMLIVGTGKQVWGTYDVDARTLEQHDTNTSGNYDLLDFAATQTLLNGGTVYAVPDEHVPDGGSVVAIYRY